MCAGIADVPGGQRDAQPERFGDVVLARKDAPAIPSLRRMTMPHRVSRWSCAARDLKPATDVQRPLQALMGWPTLSTRITGC
jgi:glutamyl-Q tRNA(Asp) synthetase